MRSTARSTHDPQSLDLLYHPHQNTDLHTKDLTTLLEELASFKREGGYIFGAPVLLPIVWPSNRAVGHNNRQQQLDSGILTREQRLGYVI